MKLLLAALTLSVGLFAQKPCVPTPFNNCSTAPKPVTVVITGAPTTGTVLQSATPNPASLLCNAARMAPYSPDFIAPPPLNLDAAIAAGQVKYCLGCFPYPFTPAAGPIAPSVWAADMQCANDWELITSFTGVEQSLGLTLNAFWVQGLATQWSDALIYLGVTYTPAKVPFP